MYPPSSDIVQGLEALDRATNPNYKTSQELCALGMGWLKIECVTDYFNDELLERMKLKFL